MSRPFKIRGWLRPLGWIFGSLARCRRALYSHGVLRVRHPAVPAICVGNIAVGGTGKTPHVAYIVELLSTRYRVALLSRGYGRKSHGFVLANTTPPEKLSAHLIGDEPLLLYRRFPNLPLAVDGDRDEGVRRLCAYDSSVEVVVMDDAYQHLNFVPTVKLVLTEFHRPYFRDYPMPAGRLREFPDAVSAADAVLVTKVDVPPESIRIDDWRHDLGLRPDQPLFFTKYVYDEPVPMTDPAESLFVAPTEVLLLTGIARPQPLLDYLKEKYKVCHHECYPDHHLFSLTDLNHIRTLAQNEDHSFKPIFTTEKDWMRLWSGGLQKDVSLLPFFIVPVHVDFLSISEKLNFNSVIENYVSRAKKESL